MLKLKCSEKVFCIVAIATILGISLGVTYVDCKSITAWSYDFLDAFFKGDLKYLHAYAATNIHGSLHVLSTGNIISIIPLAIWNFPVWLLTKIIGIKSIDVMGCLIWTKIFFLIALIIIIYYFGKIECNLTQKCKRGKYSILILLGSAEVILSIAYAGQDEIIYICVFIMALYYYLSEKKTLFYVLSMISVGLCPIMILPYILLVVAQDKNLFSIIGKVLLSVTPICLSTMIYANAPRVIHSGGGDNFLEWFFGRTLLNTGWGPFSIVAILITFILLQTFFCDYDKMDSTEARKRIVYNLALTMSVLSFLGWDQYYRSFIWLPFVVLIFIGLEKEKLDTCIVLVLIVEILRTILSVINQPVLFQISDLAGWLMNLLNLNGGAPNVISSLRSDVVQSYYLIYILINSVTLTMIGYIFWICNYRNKDKKYIIGYSKTVAFSCYLAFLPLLVVGYLLMGFTI